ncbi:unnamed protein product [Mytilus edulis]|uniref:Reverse transcriptase/retrotransposon-derived protein RNase H-like domain-containing protein n=1 Tax=Mytilus edulis TaxID=6550 RepID=A0A8S3T283_MYTED|nr:unnamed protein product [Mytilus edulis]
MKYLISSDLSLTLDLKNALDFSFQIGSICLAEMLMCSRRFEPIDFERAVLQACLYDKIDIIDWFGKTMLKDIKNFDKDYDTPLLKILGWSYNLCKSDFEELLWKACNIGVHGLKLLQLAPLQKHINVKSLSIVANYDSLLKSHFMAMCKSQNIDFQYIFSSSIENGKVCRMLKELLNIRSFENILNVSFTTQMFRTAIINGNFDLIKAIIEVVNESKYLSVLPECLQLAVEHSPHYTHIIDFFLTTIKHEQLNCSKAFKTACELGRRSIVQNFLKKVRIIDLDCSFEFLLSLTKCKKAHLYGLNYMIVQHCFCGETVGRENYDDFLDFRKCNKSIIAFPIIDKQIIPGKENIKLVFLKQKGSLVDILKVETSKDESELIDRCLRKEYLVHILTERSSVEELKKHFIQMTFEKCKMMPLTEAERKKFKAGNDGEIIIPLNEQKVDSVDYAEQTISHDKEQNLFMNELRNLKSLFHNQLGEITHEFSNCQKEVIIAVNQIKRDFEDEISSIKGRISQIEDDVHENKKNISTIYKMMEQNKDLVNHSNHMSDMVNTENISKGDGQAVPDEANQTNQNTEKQQQNTDNIYSFNKDKMYNINQNYAVLDRPQVPRLTNSHTHSSKSSNVTMKPQLVAIQETVDVPANSEMFVSVESNEPIFRDLAGLIEPNEKFMEKMVYLWQDQLKFILKYADKAKPLYEVTEKNQKFVWTEQCQQSFEELETTLISAPILAYPTREVLFILDTDASNDGMGAVLSQLQDGVEKVICYFSKTFSRSERKYCVTRRELLALVASIKHFHHYLYGKYFKVRSDHDALSWLFNFKNPEGS